MRVYIIGNDGITLCRTAPAAVNNGEIAVASNGELGAAPLSAKRLLALWNALPDVRKAKESWRPRRADRSAVVGNRGLAGPRAATRPEAPLQAGGGDCDAASARRGNGRRGGERDRLATSYRSRRLLGNLEEKARAHSCLGQRGGARPGLPHRRAGQPMRPPVHVASARQHSGEPSSGLGPNGGRNDRLRGPDLAGLDGEIAGLVDRSTQELRRAWRTLH